MEIRVYLWDMQAGQPALSSPLQSRWDSSEGKGSGRPVGWFKLSPNEQRDIPLFVEIPLTNSTGESTSSLSPGQYGLRCEIEYHMNDILAGTDMTTVTPNTTPQEIAEAKAQGRVLVYMGQLWTGKVQSNIINVTLTAGP